MSTLKAGLAGCGQNGRAAIDAIAQHRHCDVVALFDPDPAAMQELSDHAGIDLRCPDYEALLRTGVDFVVLADPVGRHRAQVEAAAQQGVHCLLHAPFARDAAEADAMVACCEDAGVKLGVLAPWQQDPLLEQLRLLLAQDCLGGVVQLHAMLGDDRVLRQPPAAGDWRRDPGVTGAGAFLRLLSAPFSVATWLLGRPAVAVAALASKGFTVLDEDACAVAARLRGGALCTFAGSHLARGWSLAVNGTDGFAVLTHDRLQICGRSAFRSEVLDYPEPRRERSYLRHELQSLLAPAAQHLELHGRFARWLDDRDDFPLPGDQAAADQRVVDAIGRAVAEGITVAV